ncbi:DNA pantothenate metabolism flavoprotein domain containing protein [Aphelenchoides besseyi]|nr:DNA pantothenate metabolism flavoprotein domain containing protein [Aphelenchoides besseyi]
MLIGLDAAFRKACGSDTRDFCSEFLENGRKLLRDELDAERFKVEFEVDEFLPLDHHGNLGYRKIGNYTVEGKYNEIDEYRHYVGGNLKSDFQLTSNCVAPLCVCNKQLVRSGNKRSSSSNSKLLRGQQGGIRWFYAPTSMLLKLEETMLNYVLLGSTATVISVAVITLLLIIYKVYTRVIKGNQSLGILSLIGIIALNLTACLHILDGAEEITNLRLLLSDMGHCTCFGVIFIKAIRLRNAEDLCSERKTSNIGYFNYVLLMFFVLAVQIAIHLHQIDTVALQEVYAQAYIAILLLFALWINVKNREIRRNYKESKWLFIANLMALALYASWAVIRSLVDHSSIRYVDIVELNLMGLLLLTFLFGPKIYILLLYEPFVVERYSPDISTHTNASRKGSLSAHRSGSTVTADESGGTRVDLEKNAVRYIENFSMGNRGAASTEYFLEQGYAVIFFHREGSLRPFSRRVPNLFDRLKLDANNKAYIDSNLELDRAVADNLKYKNQILFTTFVSVNEYLHGLELICKELHQLGSRALIYLAAAVSDFYIREEQLILDRLVEAVVPNSFVVSFKLETDPEILVSKAQRALQKYKHSLVIGNILKTRKTSVVFVQDNHIDELNLSTEQKQAGIEIESLIVERLYRKHNEFINSK